MTPGADFLQCFERYWRAIHREGYALATNAKHATLVIDQLSDQIYSKHSTWMLLCKDLEALPVMQANLETVSNNIDKLFLKVEKLELVLHEAQLRSDEQHETKCAVHNAKRLQLLTQAVSKIIIDIRELEGEFEWIDIATHGRQNFFVDGCSS